MNSITKVLGNRILIEPIADQRPTSEVIVIPDKVEQLKVPFGRVVLMGEPRCKNKWETKAAAQMGEVKIGDYVRVDNKMGSTDVLYQGKPHRLVSIMDIQIVLPAEMAAIASVEMLEN